MAPDDAAAVLVDRLGRRTPRARRGRGRGLVGPRRRGLPLRGFDADLTSTSVDGRLGRTSAGPTSGSPPRRSTGSCSARATTGAVALMGLPDSLDVDELADTFEELGYQRAERTTGVWEGGEELLATPGAGASRHSSATSRSTQTAACSSRATARAYLEDGRRGPWTRTSRPRSRRRAPRHRRPAVGGALHRRPGLPRAGHVAGRRRRPGDRRRADRGGRRGEPDDRVRASAPSPAATSASRCRSRPRTRPAPTPTRRAQLAAGPAPGQGGDFADRFDLGEVTADGRRRHHGAAPPWRAATSCPTSPPAPVLFATC